MGQWSTDPHNNLIIGNGVAPNLCSDNVGGCYVTYEVSPTYPTGLVLQRLDKFGYQPWGLRRQLTGLLPSRSEEHTSELQSHHDLVCRLLLEKKKKKKKKK